MEISKINFFFFFFFKADLLKFTSLWLQYMQIDNTFYGLNQQNNMDWGVALSVTDNMPFNNNSTKVWMVGAEQVWKSTSGRPSPWKYAQADYDTAGVDDAKNWTAGATYQYTPAVAFQLAHDNIDFGGDDDDHLIKFRTSAAF